MLLSSPISSLLRGFSSTSAKTAGMALSITRPEWSQLGAGGASDPSVAGNLNETIDRLTSLLLIRIAAWIQVSQTYTDLSTTTICQEIMTSSDLWPKSLTKQVMDEMKLYVGTILKGYREVPYHNFEHCYHVSVSVNKIMDMIVEPLGKFKPTEEEPLPPDTFGFKDDPLMQLAVLFAALVHDVEHQGIPNRQLANEDDDLAILYNDTSVAEQHSLCYAFSELLKPEYENLRDCLFPVKDDYRRFRKAVVNLVLCTDIADPERSQLTKSKWKEAFGDPYETVERKVRKAFNAEKRKGTQQRKHSRPTRRMSTVTILSDLSGDGPGLGNSDDYLISDDSSVSLSPDESSEDERKSPVPKKQPVQARTEPKPQPPKEEAKFQEYEVLLSSESAPPSLNGAPRKSKTKRRNGKDTSHSSHHSSSGKQQRRQRHSVPDDNRPHLAGGDRVTIGMAKKFYRRLSKDGEDDTKKRGTRLGLMRTVDLTGERIQNFNTLRRTSAAPQVEKDVQSEGPKKGRSEEEMNDLRETVLMETILLAGDVAHNLQGWEQMAKWSNRLFMELRKAFVEGRGFDPTDGWYKNQIGFLEAYLLPLARRLDDTGVFGDERGSIFETIVYDNRDRWHKEGMSLAANIIKTGNEVFPEDD
eukprot:scaffold7025_cov123-Cylindrotheca_fusiformis.AAC.9